MRPALIVNLSSVLFKSYLRAGRQARVGRFYSHPKVMLVADLAAFIASFALLQYVLPRVPVEIVELMQPLAWQALVGFPIILTSAIIVAGLMFELGQTAGLSSSEAVNWLPVSPSEYVAASAISIATLYSVFFAVGVGVTLPLALEFGLMYVWPVAMLLSVLGMFLGAFIVEILRAAMNRVSSTVYGKRGRFGILSRLVLLVLLFVAVQMAFSPYILYAALGVIAAGVDVAWVVPVIWPSVALIRLIRLEMLPALAFVALSTAFTVLVFEVASTLRLRYWSPTPVTIVISSSAEYVPHTSGLTRFGFNPLEAAIALKEFRALVRRKDMARFVAIPIVLVISFMLPMVFAPSDSAGRSPGFFLAAMIPFMVPLMFSTITVGQEGKAVINICTLPISAKEFIKGKLTPAWTISAVVAVGVVGAMETVAPMGAENVLAAIVAGLFVILIGSFIGLGVGSRYPDYAVGTRSRYVTLKGFFIGFLANGFSTLAVFAPVTLYVVTSGGIRGSVPLPSLSLTAMLPITIIIGCTLSYLAYRYCRTGVSYLLSNLEA